MNTRSRYYWLAICPLLLLSLIEDATGLFSVQGLLVYQFATQSAPVNFNMMMNRLIEALRSAEVISLQGLMFDLVCLVVFAVWFRSERRALAEENGGFEHYDTLKGYPVVLYGGIVVLAIASQYVCSYIVELVAKNHGEWLDIYTEIFSYMDSDKLWVNGVNLLSLVITGPIAEELCFRSLTYSISRRVMTHGSANLLQAFFFAGVHGNPMQMIFTFIFGLVLGNIYGKTGNLWLVVMIHGAFNLVPYFMESYIGVGATPVSFYCILLVSLMAAYGGYRLIMRSDDARRMLQESEEML